ncbi:hypothetical protein QE152_g4750 [Popillia japonica]|uniref:Uncharacterized protein n=1 Tax=Popillia japonica TaxID=7064 RepID=A0AAW1N0C0_POPJA
MELSQLGMKNDIYDVKFETTRIKRDQTFYNSDVDNTNSNISYISEDSCNKQEDVNDTNSVVHERNMEVVWNEFQVPWEKIPTYMIRTCDNGKKSKQIITEIIHIMVNEMRQIKTNIPSKAFKLVALKLAERFPHVFRDFDEDGVVIGDGTHSITMKLLDRNNYLNRPRKRSLNASDGRRYRKTVQNARIGCSNWEPNQPSSTKNSRITLTNTNPFSDHFYKLLNETYADQRKFFNNVNNPPSIFEIKNKWPAILSTPGIFWHFEKLTSIDLNEVMKNIREKSNKLLKFGIEKKLIEEWQTNNDKDLTSLQVISKYFKEELKTLYRCYKNISRANIPAEDLPHSPSVIEFESAEESGYMVYLEQVPINDDVYLIFVEAFVISFALYFITNLQYPKDVCYTMEMIQRYYCKIHPDVGSKSGKKIGAKSRVLTLINKLHQTTTNDVNSSKSRVLISQWF